MKDIQFADFHCDTILSVVHDKVDFAKSNSKGHIDLPRLLETGYVFQCFAVFCEPRYGQEAMLRQTLRLLENCHQHIFSCPEVELVTNGQFPVQRGKVAGLLAIEGADFIGDDLFLVDLVYQLGVRLITLTWNGRNSLADGVGLKETAGGLTLLGREALGRMQQKNIIVDVSHLAEKGFWDAIEATTRPLVASHSNARVLCDHPRNLTDEQIRAVGSSGGLVGLNLAPHFVAARPEGQTLMQVARHAAHIADLIGPEALCLGFDLDGIGSLPQKMKDVTDTPLIIGALTGAGFSSKDVRNICSENLIRFVSSYLG